MSVSSAVSLNTASSDVSSSLTFPPEDCHRPHISLFSWIRSDKYTPLSLYNMLSTYLGSFIFFSIFLIIRTSSNGFFHVTFFRFLEGITTITRSPLRVHVLV